MNQVQLTEEDSQILSKDSHGPHIARGGRVGF